MVLNQQPSPLSTPYPFTVETTTHWDDVWLCLWSRAGRHDSPFQSWGWSRQRDINSLPPGLLKTMSNPCYKDLTGICYQSHQFLTAGATGLPPTLQCNPRIQTQSVTSTPGSSVSVQSGSEPWGPNSDDGTAALLGPSLSVTEYLQEPGGSLSPNAV